MTDKERRMLAYSTVGFVLAFAGTVYFISRKKQNPPLDVVPEVDLNKYAGEWFEIARFPAFFERNCNKAKAHYSLNDDGTLKVVNTCQKDGSSAGKLKKAEATAYVIDKATNAKLKVKFWGGLVKGDYQIIALDSDYNFAMVGTDDRKHLWILSRAPQLETRVVSELLEKARAQGFDTTRLIFTHHN